MSPNPKLDSQLDKQVRSFSMGEGNGHSENVLRRNQDQLTMSQPIPKEKENVRRECGPAKQRREKENIEPNRQSEYQSAVPLVKQSANVGARKKVLPIASKGTIQKTTVSYKKPTEETQDGGDYFCRRKYSKTSLNKIFHPKAERTEMGKENVSNSFNSKVIRDLKGEIMNYKAVTERNCLKIKVIDIFSESVSQNRSVEAFPLEASMKLKESQKTIREDPNRNSNKMEPIKSETKFAAKGQKSLDLSGGVKTNRPNTREMFEPNTGSRKEKWLHIDQKTPAQVERKICTSTRNRDRKTDFNSRERQNIKPERQRINRSKQEKKEVMGIDMITETVQISHKEEKKRDTKEKNTRFTEEQYKKEDALEVRDKKNPKERTNLAFKLDPFQEKRAQPEQDHEEYIPRPNKRSREGADVGGQRQKYARTSLTAEYELENWIERILAEEMVERPTIEWDLWRSRLFNDSIVSQENSLLEERDLTKVDIPDVKENTREEPSRSTNKETSDIESKAVTIQPSMDNPSSVSESEKAPKKDRPWWRSLFYSDDESSEGEDYNIGAQKKPLAGLINMTDAKKKTDMQSDWDGLVGTGARPTTSAGRQKKSGFRQESRRSSKGQSREASRRDKSKHGKRRDASSSMH